MHRQLSQFKKKLRSTRNRFRNHRGENRNENTDGLRMLEDPDLELVVVSSDGVERNSTQHVQPSITTIEAAFDPNQNRHSSNSSDQSIDSYDRCYIDQMTDALTLNDAQESKTITARLYNSFINEPDTNHFNTNNLWQARITSSPISYSTDDSKREYSRSNSSISNAEYVEQQQLNLQSIIIFEIDANNQRRSLEDELEERETCVILFDDLLKENLRLKNEYEDLQERLKNSPWLCRSCSWENTKESSVCEMCESPSPARIADLLDS